MKRCLTHWPGPEGLTDRQPGSDVGQDCLEAGQAVSADSNEKWPHLSFGFARLFPQVIAIELAGVTAIILW